MALFTVITDFRGGTYVPQVDADDLRSALERWSRLFTEDQSTGLRRRTRELVAGGAVADGEPARLTGLTNVWFVHAFVHAFVRGGGACVNIVSTSRDPVPTSRRRGS